MTPRGRRHPILIATCVAWVVSALAILAILSDSARAKPQAAKPSARTKQQQQAIKNAVKLLTEEAQKAKHAQKLSAPTADFASRFKQEIHTDDLIEALTQKTSQDSFIDAYIRWQLTSFDPLLPSFDDRQFLKLMNNAPAMVANPRADEQLVTTFQKAEKKGKLPPAESNQLRETASEIDRRSKVAEALNHPAEAYRDWIAQKIGETGPRHLQWLIESCAATITAGWPTRSIKSRISKEFKTAANDKSIATQQRQLIAEQARTLIGMKRSAISEITFFADGSISVSFTNPAVDKDDVDKWIAQLNGTK